MLLDKYRKNSQADWAQILTYKQVPNITHQNEFYLNAFSEGCIFTDGLANNERAFVSLFVFDLLMNTIH
jgi:hypothetical protein